MPYIEIAIFIFSIILLYFSFHNKNGLPTNWPIVGMIPALLINLHRIHDYITESAPICNLTFLFKGPWFSNMRILITVDPANVHHLMIENFDNYSKGDKYKEIFDVFGDGLLNTDFEAWKHHRKLAQSYMNDTSVHQFLVRKLEEKIDEGLVPILDHVAKQGLEIDLQDLFQRFTFDIICSLVIDYDPMSLSLDFPRVSPSEALDVVEEVIPLRYAVPTCVWKFQRWLGVGMEKKYMIAWDVLDDFIYKCVTRKRELMKLRSSKQTRKDMEIGVDLMTLYMDQTNENKHGKDDPDDKFIRDTILSFVIAGRDTTSTALSWFFYLLSKNPHVVIKIREELASVMVEKNPNKYYEFVDKLVYLHGALCESLRLYPPVVFEGVCPVKQDILPSGHTVDQNMQVFFNMYAMGRMKGVWGDDCEEFRPERWITSSGKIKHEPSHKFFAFNAGPRSCLGKNMAFVQMKAVAVAILQNYHVQVVEGCVVEPRLSVILRMKHGLKVKILDK